MKEFSQSEYERKLVNRIKKSPHKQRGMHLANAKRYLVRLGYTTDDAARMARDCEDIAYLEMGIIVHG